MNEAGNIVGAENTEEDHEAADDNSNSHLQLSAKSQSPQKTSPGIKSVISRRKTQPDQGFPCTQAFAILLREKSPKGIRERGAGQCRCRGTENEGPSSGIKRGLRNREGRIDLRV